MQMRVLEPRHDARAIRVVGRQVRSGRQVGLGSGPRDATIADHDGGGTVERRPGHRQQPADAANEQVRTGSHAAIMPAGAVSSVRHAHGVSDRPHGRCGQRFGKPGTHERGLLAYLRHGR